MDLTATGGESASEQKRRVRATYGDLPLSFEANKGQADPRVKFLTHGRNVSLFLTADELVLAADATVRMRLLGANPSPRVSGRQALPGTSNYFVGNDPAAWRTNIPTFAQVVYEQVYPGIDLVAYGKDGRLEYDLVVAPGKDPKRIRLAFSGVDSLAVDGAGDLLLRAGSAEFRQHEPIVYQDIDGQRHAVAGRFVVFADDTVGFDIAPYRTAHPLVIDPALSYSTYLGGSMGAAGLEIDVDSEGSAYVIGRTFSFDFPTVNPFQATRGARGMDAFIAKLNPQGTALVYSTYLGGTDGDNSGVNAGSIAVDRDGNACVTGNTASTDFPLRNAFQTENGRGGPVLGDGDAFVAKLNPAGNDLLFSSYLGGTGVETPTAIAVDPAGNCYVTGGTTSYQVSDVPQPTKFPTTGGALQPDCGTDAGHTCNFGLSDAFVAKIDTAGGLAYATYLGGNSVDIAYAIAVDDAGNAYVTGDSASFQESGNPVVTRFPTTAGAYQENHVNPGGPTDAFVAKLNSSGSAVMYATYIGGVDADGGHGIAVDELGNAHVAGTTLSTDFPTTPGAHQQVANPNDFLKTFVLKLSPTGSSLTYSTYLSGAPYVYGLVRDGSGNVHVAGRSAGGLTVIDPVQAEFAGGGGDAYVTSLNADGSALVFSTYLGGRGQDDAQGIAIDADNRLYLTGFTDSDDFPVVNALQATTSSQAAFVARIDLSASSTNTPTQTPPSVSTATATPTVTNTPGRCPGECNGDRAVTVDELIRAVNIALGNAALGTCPSIDGNGDGQVTVDELVRAVGAALGGCP